MDAEIHSEYNKQKSTFYASAFKSYDG